MQKLVQSGTTWLALSIFGALWLGACGASHATASSDADDAGAGGQSGSSSGSFGGGSSGLGGAGGFSSGSSTSSGSGTSARGDGGMAVGCDPTCAAAHGTCTGSVCTISENPGGIDTTTEKQLQTGGSADTTLKWLYPYDRTVFPRGLVSPTLQFNGMSADSAYIRIKSTTVDYTGYVKVTQSPIAFSLPQPSWNAVAAAALGTDPVEVDVTVSDGGKVTGPIKESWTIAPGRLQGIVYHETYNSPLAGAVGIMRIQIGDTKPTVFKSGCGNVCHTASADGSTLVADTTITTSASYDLKNNAATLHMQSDDSFAYGGLYPDGTLVMSSTNYLGGFNTKSQLYNTKTGATVAAPGWDTVITQGGTTAFSPDGKQIGFVHEDKDMGHTLAKMDFDVTQTKFTNLVDLATDSKNYLAWPAFTPDGKSVVYHAGSSAAFQAGYGTVADLFIVDIATRTVQRLDSLDGYVGSGSGTYLPANDTGFNATPTVLPEAVGGYFWVVFTSHRSYGNLLATNASSGTLGKLWVAAIDVNEPPGTDPSHPAFYLDGQEMNADNLRGFLTLPPCEAAGATCTSGDQCCGGYCGQVSGGLRCTDKPPPCSNELDKCATSSDCCNPADLCINNRCSQPPPPK